MLGFILFLFSFNTHASLDFYGNVGAQYLFFPQKLSDTREGSRPLALANVNLKYEFSEKWKTKINLYSVIDPLTKAEPQKYLVELPEAVVEWSNVTSTFKLGLNVFQWGVTEGYDPLAVVNSSIFWNPLSLQKLSAPSVVFSTSVKALNFDFIYIPINRTGKFPQQGSRWIPNSYVLSRSDSTGVIVLPQDFNYNYSSANVLDSALLHNYGIRLRESVGDFDWSLVYFEGAGNFPLLDVFVNVQRVDIDPQTGTIYSYVSPDLNIVPVVPRMRSVGYSLVYTWDRVIFRYAGNYQSAISQYATLVDWSQGNVFGLEKAWTSQFTTILEYSYINHAKKFDNNVTSAQALFKNSLALGFRYTIGENWTLTGLALNNFSTEDQMLHAKVSRRLWDVFALDLGWTEIKGSSNSQSQLAAYGANDFLDLTIKYHF